MSVVTRINLIDEIARAADLTKKDADVVIEEVFKSIVDCLKESKSLELRGFGTFRVHYRKARIGRNPKTGNAIEIQGKNTIQFKPGKDLKDLINS